MRATRFGFYVIFALSLSYCSGAPPEETDTQTQSGLGCIITPPHVSVALNTAATFKVQITGDPDKFAQAENYTPDTSGGMQFASDTIALVHSSDNSKNMGDGIYQVSRGYKPSASLAQQELRYLLQHPGEMTITLSVQKGAQQAQCSTTFHLQPAQ